MIFPMAEKAKKIRITNSEDGPDASDVSFEAANAVPAVLNDDDDERQPIDLDTPIDLNAALAGASQVREADAAPPFDDAPAPADLALLDVGPRAVLHHDMII